MKILKNGYDKGYLLPFNMVIIILFSFQINTQRHYFAHRFHDANDS